MSGLNDLVSKTVRTQKLVSCQEDGKKHSSSKEKLFKYSWEFILALKEHWEKKENYFIFHWISSLFSKRGILMLVSLFTSLKIKY